MRSRISWQVRPRRWAPLRLSRWALIFLGHPSRHRPERTLNTGSQRDTNNAATVLQAENTKYRILFSGSLFARHALIPPHRRKAAAHAPAATHPKPAAHPRRQPGPYGGCLRKIAASRQVECLNAQKVQSGISHHTAATVLCLAPFFTYSRPTGRQARRRACSLSATRRRPHGRATATMQMIYAFLLPGPGLPR